MTVCISSATWLCLVSVPLCEVLGTSNAVYLGAEEVAHLDGGGTPPVLQSSLQLPKTPEDVPSFT